MQKKCQQCNKFFQKGKFISLSVWSKTKFCSNWCRGLAMRGVVRKIPIMKNCIVCGKLKIVKPYRLNTFRFCSPKCKGIFMKNSIPWNKGKKGLMPTPWNKGISLPVAVKLKLSQISKGKHFSPNTEFKKGHTMNKGEKSYWWKGGTTPINKLLRRSIEFKLWRESVFKRDDWTCQKCHIRGKELHPHHIKSFALFPELRFAIDNGVTLCKNCHVLTDSWGRNITQKHSIIALNN
jgi:predicted nucleic acid-binding Zn ribbon protein